MNPQAARLFLAMLTGLFFAGLAPSAATDGTPEDVECATCEGQGHALLDCRICDGSGKAPCIECRPSLTETMLARSIPILKITDPELGRKYEELEKEMAGILKDPGIKVGARYHDRPGILPCPATGCAKGKCFLNRGLPCKVCRAKGEFTCSTCKGKGVSRCFACRGRKQAIRRCPECRGSGKSDDPASRTAAVASRCPFCLGTPLVDCTSCDEGRLLQVCHPCAGSGERLCKRCIGRRKMPCKNCSGTGEVTYIGDSTSKRCPTCKRTGTLDCSDCRKGVVTCKTCSGKGEARITCLDCFGTKMAPCGGCWDGSYEGWSITGEQHLAAERLEAAAAYLEVALDRARRRHAKLLEAIVGDDKAAVERRRKLRKALDRRESELGKRLAKTR